jgi:glutamate-1-semialdehyde 2,1-aminomutase
MKTTDAFLAKTSSSKQWFERAQQSIPGGVTANIKYFDPYPIFMTGGKGACLFDADGNTYIDYNLCYGALILGHGHPAVKKAIEEQWKGMGTTVTGTPHPLEVEMAEKLISLYPGIQQVRFTNSGLEATMFALRLAMAWTGKRKIAKFAGHYHGGYDQVLISIRQEKDRNGYPLVTADSRGLPDYYRQNTIVLPFNDWDRTEELITRHRDELAAVILEPVQGGFLPPRREFLVRLREITQLYQIPLIFDEVKTGFRLGISGAQGRYGVIPDLTALGKVLGGGFPIGAVGGRKEIMEICSPVCRSDLLTFGGANANSEDVLFHSGTYNGHPSVLAAGMATIRVLEQEGVYEAMEESTMSLRRGMEEILSRHQLSGRTIGDGTIFNLVITRQDQELEEAQQIFRPDFDLRRKLDFALLERGIYLKPMNRFSLSIAHDEQVIQETLFLFEEGVKTIRKGV